MFVTRMALKRRRAVFFIALAACLAVIFYVGASSKTVNSDKSLTMPDILIDAGHGGLDGGAVSADGISESGINLAVANKLYFISNFCGSSAILTRTDENSLEYNPENSINKNKNNDLKARVKMANSYSNADFLSIHLNKFSDTKYFGAQVFYRKDAKSEVLASTIQNAMYSLSVENKRVAKQLPSQNYIMDRIKNTAVIVECGFLSNVKDTELLNNDSYQKKVATAIYSGYTEYKYKNQ